MTSPQTSGALPTADLSGVLDGSLPPGLYRWRPSEGDPGPAEGPEEAGWDSRVVDLADVSGKSGFLQRCAESLGFPDSFGYNWDALADCLTDLSWTDPPEQGRLLLVRGWDRFTEAAPRDAATAADVLAAAVGFWGGRATPMTVLLS
ncbi:MULTISPECIES: barstar family protein [unclassified Streptomyces]|uniref:barstar family protein n=1 Tax=unclassified Streptomyces TaxID=2593676 RepID=UPI0022B6018A|nr:MULTISPECIES: barstar family protein [unclassified Streptomyces]MCZ7413532.1 barstar family protein [Streptomyces sp. WMMC897]MCZ7430527.1 barstar family protein [Streptomyces sp. WMMC1477]